MNQQSLFVNVYFKLPSAFYISVSRLAFTQTLAQKQHKHFRTMNALTIAASCLILAKAFTVTQHPGPRTRFNKDTRSQWEVGETYRSSLVVKTKPSSESKDALT